VPQAVTVDLRRRFGLRHPEAGTEMTMTDYAIALLDLIEKQADGDLLREMLAYAAGRIIEAEVQTRTGAAKARAPARWCGRFSKTEIATAAGTPGRGGSSWRDPSCAKACPRHLP